MNELYVKTSVGDAKLLVS